MTNHVTDRADGGFVAPSRRLAKGAMVPRRVGRGPGNVWTSARRRPDEAHGTRTTVAGLALGGLIVVTMVVSSSVLTLLASIVAIAASVLSPLVGMVTLAFLAPLARPLVIPPPGFYVAMTAAMLFGLILRLPVERPRLRLPSAEVLLLGAFLLYVVSHALAGELDGYSGSTSREAAALLARLSESVVTFGVAYVVLRGRSPYPVLAALLVSAAIGSVLALTQVVGADDAFPGLMDPTGESNRISGAFGDPNYFGAYLGSMIALALALVVEVGSTRVKVALLALASLLSTALLFTQSRGAFVALMAGIVTIAFVRSRRVGVLSIAALVLIAAIAYPAFSEWRFEGDDARAAAGLGDAAGRTDAWSSGVESFASSPLFGIGLGRFTEESPGGIEAHNWYVQVLAELGIAGLIIWSLFIAALIMALRGRPRPARSVGYSVLVVWMVAGLTLSVPGTYQLTGPVLITIAAAAVALWPSGRQEVEATTLPGPLDQGPSPTVTGPYERVAASRRLHT